MNTLKTFEQYTPSDEALGKQPNDPFQHNRLIAGYHENKALGLQKFIDDSRNSLDPKIQKVVGQYEKRRIEQADKAAYYMEQARKHHREDIHGNFDECIPGKEDCITYYNNQ